MAAGAISKPRIVELAERMHADIRRRHLKPGDPYLTAAEAARTLRVNKTAANRAMQLLAQRGVIQRRQRLGAIIADPEPTADGRGLGTVHLLVHQNYLKREGLYADGIVVGLQGVLPRAHIQFNFLPADDAAGYVEDLISRALASGKPEGFVLVRSSLPAQRAMARSGLPVVVHGTLYPSVRNLPSIDYDHAAVGRMLAEHTLRQGHRRVIVLMRERMLPGDHPFMDGIAATLGEAGLLASDVIYRDLPMDRDAVVDGLSGLLDAPDADRPGVIARSEPLADGAAAARAALGLTDREVSISVAHVYRRGAENPPAHPYVRPTLTPEEQGRRIGAMLAAAHADPTAPPRHETIPAVLQASA